MSTMKKNVLEMLVSANSGKVASTVVSRRAGILTVIGGVLSLAGCGGGGVGGSGTAADAGAAGIAPGDSGAGAVGGDTSVAGVSSGGTGSTSVGSVTGFGSIYLNGGDVRIDDASATVSDEDGANKKGSLKLGMRVTVVSTVSVAGDVTAQSIVVGGELQGPVDRLSAGNGRFEVLGQTVVVVGGTVFDASLPNGLLSLGNGNLVEVHGLLNADRNEITATFIDKKDNASVAYFKIQGLVKNLLPGPKEFRIDNLDIGYATTPAAGLLTTPVEGAYVRLRLNLVPVSNVWQATRISGPATTGQNGSQSEIEGRVTAFNSATTFAVDGVSVQTNGATGFDNGQITLASMGSWVEVKGVMTAGVLVATRVKLENDSGLATLEYRLTGNLSGLIPITATTGTFSLRGYTVQFADAGTPQNPFDHGTLVNLVNGTPVEVRGTAVAGVANTLLATRIKFL